MADETTTFGFEGRTIPAAAGQSIAGALTQAGVSTLSRSPKYHRPRGYMCGFGACGDCALTVDGMPGVISCTTRVEGGEEVSREQGVPGTGFDLLRSADLIKRWLPAGFQFRLLTKQPRLSAWSSKVMAVLAGGGRYPSERAVARSLVTGVEHLTPDVAVVGGGVSGLTAALAAANAGAQVVVTDRDFLGGRSGVRTEPITDMDGHVVAPRAVFGDLLVRARTHDRVTLLTGAALGWIDGTLPVVGGSTRWELRPTGVLIATGSYEIPQLFMNNDRPGVMLADGAVKLAETEHCLTGKRVVVTTDSDRGHQVAERLDRAGCRVVAIADARSSDQTPSADSRFRVIAESSPVKVHGLSHVRALTIAVGDTRERLPTDIVCVALGRRPAEELALHFGAAAAGSSELAHEATIGAGAVVVASVGTAAGDFDYSTPDIVSIAAAMATTVRERAS